MMYRHQGVIQIIREYVRSYINLVQESKGATRAARAGAAHQVFNILEAYFLKQGRNLILVSAATKGRKDADLTVTFGKATTASQGNDSEEIQSSSEITWNIEVKSFNDDKIFGLEMNVEDSELSKIILPPSARQTFGASAAAQIQHKISSEPHALEWAENALQQKGSSFYDGFVDFDSGGEFKDLRFLKVSRGNIGDWKRLKSASVRFEGDSIRGQYRSFYTVSNKDLAKLKQSYTDAQLEDAIQADLVGKGDHVFVLHSASSGKIRCYSLTDEAENEFDFPQFASGGRTLAPGKSRVTSTGGGGRIGIVCEVLPGTGEEIS